VGLLGSASATAGVGVVLPLMAVLQAVGFMFGHGSGNHMSRSLGARETEDAERMAATGFFSALIAGAVLGALGLIFLKPLAYLLGSTPTIAPHAMDYMLYILIGGPWFVSSLVLNNQLRFQGSAFYSMLGITSGAVLNVALDPLFIFGLGMGVGGAALATILSQFVSFVVLLLGTRRGGNIPIRFRAFTPTRTKYREILRGGVPSLFRQGLGSISVMLLNAAAAGFGDAAVAAMSIVTRVTQFLWSAVIGFGQGFQPICGFNYGGGYYDRVREAFWFCVKISFVFLLVVGAVAMVFAPQVIWVFLKDDPQVTRIGALALRLQCAALPLFSFVIVSNMLLQTMGLAAKASLMAAARQGLFLIPAALILPRFFGLLGVQMSQPVADVLSFILALPVTLGVLKELKEGRGCAGTRGEDGGNVE
jgi:putative MATE family efflux protein